MVGEMTGSRLTIIVELSQDSTGWLSEESIVDVARAVTVAFRGLGDCHQSAHANGTRVTAMTEGDLAKNHQWPQRAFGHVVRGWHQRIIQKHEPLVLMLQNSLLQCECFFVSQWKSDQLRQAFSQPELFFDLLSLREFALLPQSMKATSVVHELANGLE